MVRINDKTIDDFLGSTQNALQNSLIQTGYNFTYNVGTSNYVLPGYKDSNERIYSIDSIEGVGFLPEDYLTENDLTEGVDYSLYDGYTSEEFVPDGFGSAAGKQVFTGITIADQTFKDGTTIHIKYTYQNPNYVPILSNYAQNSVLRMILTATLLNIQQTNAELVESINNFGLNSSGDDLDRLATLVGLQRTEGELASGQVLLKNTSQTDSYTVNTSNRFAALAGGYYLAFAPTIGATVPTWDGTMTGGSPDYTNTKTWIDVVAVEIGTLYNVGVNAISFGFRNTELTNRIPSNILISNPTLGDLGQSNLFDNGLNDETDEDFRKRVSLAFAQTKSSSYSTIEKAAYDTNLISQAKTFDIETKKDLTENHIQTYVSTESGSRLSATSLSQILSAIRSVKPAGSINTVRQTLNTYINFDFNIYVNKTTLGNTSNLQTSLNTLIDNFINGKEIGEDILPSSIVSIFKSVDEVLDVEINNYTVTEFASEVYSYDGQIDIATGGVSDNWIALEMPLNSATNEYYDLEGNIAGDVLDLSSVGEPYPIDTRTAPRVNTGVTAYDGLVRRSPLDRFDYYQSATRSTITYDPSAGIGDGINTTDYVLFNYNYYDNTLIDGLRIRLGGDSGTVVGVDFGYGSNPDSINFSSFVTDELLLDAMTITLDGTEKLYEVPFLSSGSPYQLELDNFGSYSPDSTKFWIILKYDSGSGDAYLPIDTTQSHLAFNPEIWTDAGSGDGTFENTTNERANWHSYTKFADANAYKKIVIPSQTDEPEKPISYQHTYTFLLYEEE